MTDTPALLSARANMKARGPQGWVPFGKAEFNAVWSLIGRELGDDTPPPTQGDPDPQDRKGSEYEW